MPPKSSSSLPMSWLAMTTQMSQRRMSSGVGLPSASFETRAVTVSRSGSPMIMMSRSVRITFSRHDSTVFWPKEGMTPLYQPSSTMAYSQASQRWKSARRHGKPRVAPPGALSIMMSIFSTFMSP